MGSKHNRIASHSQQNLAGKRFVIVIVSMLWNIFEEAYFLFGTNALY